MQTIQFLAEMRKQLGRLQKSQLVESKVYCSKPIAQLPMCPNHSTLPQFASEGNHGFRDTVLYFLSSFDQQSPADSALGEEHQKLVQSCVVELPDPSHINSDPVAIVSCHLDDGLLFSIPSQPHWSTNPLHAKMMDDSSEVQSFSCRNCFGDESLKECEELLEAAAREHIFSNWDNLTNSALLAPQVEVFFRNATKLKGLENTIVRNCHKAARTGYKVDKFLVTKLSYGEKRFPVFELRINFGGTNNLRLLFSVNSTGKAVYGHAGFKNGNKWYSKVETQATNAIAKLLGIP
ncbi:MAG: hypothetical protein ABJF89_04465 [Parasphingorhabdus sp.]